MNPGIDNETPGTIHAATSSPIAHDARSTTALSRICLMAISVGRRALARSRTTMTAAKLTATTIATGASVQQSHGKAKSPRPIVALADSVDPGRLVAGR